MTKIFARMTFWDRIKKIIRLLAGISIVGMGWQDAPSWAFITIGVIGVIAEMLDIIITDVNKNGIIDIAENDQ